MALLDAMHEAALAGLNPKPPREVAETSLIYRIFAGQSRSQARPHTSSDLTHLMALLVNPMAISVLLTPSQALTLSMFKPCALLGQPLDHSAVSCS